MLRDVKSRLLTMTAKKPRGWLIVPVEVSDVVDQAIASIAPNFFASEKDPWEAGVSPRVIRMVRTLHEPETRLGPTAVEALKVMLEDANDDTWALLGGEVTTIWIHAPREFEVYVKVTARIESDDDPTVVEALSRLTAAANANRSAWKEARG